jgi:hypothetical protein
MQNLICAYMVCTSDSVYYENALTGEGSEELPTYSAAEVQWARRIQICWLNHAARGRVRRRVLSLDVVDIIRACLKKCAKIAYVGYELEGITPMQLLRRAGYWELAEVLEGFYKAMKWDIRSLTLEEVGKKPRDDYETFGVIQLPHQKDLKEFQTWWARASNNEKQKKLALFNYYTGPSDPRDIRQCIADAEEVMVNKFLRVIKTGSARTKAAVQIIMTDAYFPHSHMQVETYLKKYGDKAELARVRVFFLNFSFAL